MPDAPNSAFKTILAGRKCYRMSKDKNEVVWPPLLEAALMEGLLSLWETHVPVADSATPRAREVCPRRVQVAPGTHTIPESQQVHRRVHPQNDRPDPHREASREPYSAAPRHQRGKAQ